MAEATKLFVRNMATTISQDTGLGATLVSS
jgi:hypothetical protein